MASTAPRSAIRLVAVAAAAAVSAALLLWALASPVFAACFFAGALALGVPLALLGGRQSAEPAETELVLDRALLRAALEGGSGPLAVTDLNGAFVAANSAYEEPFGAASSVG